MLSSKMNKNIPTTQKILELKRSDKRPKRKPRKQLQPQLPK